jgi:hypothetical protein
LGMDEKCPINNLSEEVGEALCSESLEKWHQIKEDIETSVGIIATIPNWHELIPQNFPLQ